MDGEKAASKRGEDVDVSKTDSQHQEMSSQTSSGYDTGSLSPATNTSNSPRQLEDGQEVMDSDSSVEAERAIVSEKKNKPRRAKKFPEPIVRTPVPLKSPPPAVEEVGSSSENESNVPLSQRVIPRKKKIPNFRLKQSKADREILDEMDEPKQSTSGPIRREYERIRRAKLAKTNGTEPNTNSVTATTMPRSTLRRRSLPFSKVVKSPAGNPAKYKSPSPSPVKTAVPPKPKIAKITKSTITSDKSSKQESESSLSAANIVFLSNPLISNSKFTARIINPVKRAATPLPVKTVATPPPVKRAATPPPIKRVATPPPVKRAATPLPVKRAATPPPVKKSLNSKSESLADVIVDEVTVLETEPVSTPISKDQVGSDDVTASGRRLSRRKKRLRYGDDWIY